MTNSQPNGTDQVRANVRSTHSSNFVAPSVVVWNAAADGQVTTPMPFWSAYTGQSTEAIQGWGWLEAVHPDDRDRTAQAWQYALAHKIVYEVEYRLRGKDGIYRDFVVRGVPAINADGTIREWWGASTDLTEHRHLQAEQARIRAALQESESRFRRLAESNIIGIVVWDTQGNIQDANDAFLNLVGYTQADLQTGKISWKAMTPPEYEKIDRQQIHEIQTTGSCTAFEKEYIHKDGFRVPVLIGGALLEGMQDRGIAFVLDLTERKQTENALKARTEELTRLTTILAQTTTFLEKSNQELEQFAYVVSHDLKAPLRAIANLSQWIEEDLESALTDETRHQMTLLRGRVHRMEALIDGLLQYSRVGRVGTTPELTDVNALLRDVIDSLSPPPEFEITIASNLPTLKTDRLGLQQVFANLISNAIKHHDRADGKIWITVNDVGKAYEFTVQDNGQGIDPQFHQRIFGIFQTLVPRDQVENTGIGLSIVKKIVENQGGTIQLDSQLGKGATFRFTWTK